MFWISNRVEKQKIINFRLKLFPLQWACSSIKRARRTGEKEHDRGADKKKKNDTRKNAFRRGK